MSCFIYASCHLKRRPLERFPHSGTLDVALEQFPTERRQLGDDGPVKCIDVVDTPPALDLVQLTFDVIWPLDSSTTARWTCGLRRHQRQQIKRHLEDMAAVVRYVDDVMSTPWLSHAHPPPTQPHRECENVQSRAPVHLQRTAELSP